MKPAVVVENVYKKYSKRADAHLNYGISDLLAELTGRTRRIELRADEFYAVKDVSLALNESETLALVGRNGSGKTTLLKMLAGLIKPDGGRIMIAGNVQALINLGAGFNPRLTGRENVINAAAIRGLTRRESIELMDEIVGFAELEEFIDSPVETYSSGMYARLGFSASIHLRPRVLLIDEILSVGDFAFQNKCFVKMHELKRDGVTIVLVSHSHTQVVQLCDSALWLHKGAAVRLGPAKEVVKQYIEFLDEEEARRVADLNRLREENVTRRVAARNDSLYGAIYDDLDNVENLRVELIVDGRAVDSFRTHDPVRVRYGFDLKKPARDLNVSLSFWRKDGLHLTTISTLNGDLLSDARTGRVECDVEIPDFVLNPGNYVLVMPIHAGHSYLYRNVVKEFAVKGGRALHWGILDFNYRYAVHRKKLVYEHAARAAASELSGATEGYENLAVRGGPAQEERVENKMNAVELGGEMSPAETALSGADRQELPSVGPYQGLYGSKLAAVRMTDEPADSGMGAFCLKIESEGARRSGVHHAQGRFSVRKGTRYLLQCRVFSPQADRVFRLGVAATGDMIAWASDMATGAIEFFVNPGCWVHCRGVVEVYADCGEDAQLWILNWDESPLTWYLDDVSLREMTERPPEPVAAVKIARAAPGEQAPQGR